MIDGWVISVAGAIDAHEFLAQHVDVPNDQCAGGEVVSALGGHGSFGGGTVVFGTANLDSEDRSAFEKESAAQLAFVESSVGTERTAIGKADDEANVVRKGVAASDSPFIVMQANVDFTRGTAGTPPVGDISTSSPFTISALPFSGTR